MVLPLERKVSLVIKDLRIAQNAIRKRAFSERIQHPKAIDRKERYGLPLRILRSFKDRRFDIRIILARNSVEKEMATARKKEVEKIVLTNKHILFYFRGGNLSQVNL